MWQLFLFESIAYDILSFILFSRQYESLHSVLNITIVLYDLYLSNYHNIRHKFLFPSSLCVYVCKSM